MTDRIITHPQSKEYDEGWERTFAKKTIEERIASLAGALGDRSEGTPPAVLLQDDMKPMPLKMCGSCAKERECPMVKVDAAYCLKFEPADDARTRDTIPETHLDDLEDSE